jgi:2-oxoglutarate dehydrogenase E1 component
MAHRGRLNVLTCVAKKPYHELFAEFEETNLKNLQKEDIHNFNGDVAYHHAVTNKIKFNDGEEVQVNISPNSCHLEAINPVILGSVKA